MKVEFADSFFESLKKLNRQSTWWYRIWETVRYSIPNFFKNVWYFRKELYDFEAWDYRYNLNLFQRSLEATADYIEHRGYEEEVSRMKKVTKMRRVLELLNQDRGDTYLDQAQAELGELQNQSEWIWEEGRESTPEEKLHNNKVFRRANEIEKQEWDELWNIIKGEEFTSYGEYDGSNMKAWWD